eukprot:595015-Rhodomonas_salina.1
MHGVCPTVHFDPVQTYTTSPPLRVQIRTTADDDAYKSAVPPCVPISTTEMCKTILPPVCTNPPPQCVVRAGCTLGGAGYRLLQVVLT